MIKLNSNSTFLIFIFFVSFFFISNNVFAHKVTVFGWVQGKTVYVEGKFSGGKRAQNSLVECFNPAGEKIFSGHTDKNGELSFIPREKTSIRIVLKAGMGHRGEWTIAENEFADTDADIPAPVTQEKNKNSEINTVKTKFEVSKAEIQQMIEKSLDKKLNPVLKKLNEALDPNHGPGASEIFGGIGYILGLLGLATFFKYRKTE